MRKNFSNKTQVQNSFENHPTEGTKNRSNLGVALAIFWDEKSNNLKLMKIEIKSRRKSPVPATLFVPLAPLGRANVVENVIKS